MKVAVLCIVTCALFSGCLPIPGTSSRTPQISGRVLNATTRKPVSGAVIALHDTPKFPSVTTNDNGCFILPESRNFHPWIVATSVDPQDDSISADIDVSHFGFNSKRVNPWDHVVRKGNLAAGPTTTSGAYKYVQIADILLSPSH